MISAQIQSASGIIALFAIAWMFSEKRRDFRLIIPIVATLLQFVLALILLKVSILQPLFENLNQLILALQSATNAGTEFVFGYLGGGELPFEINATGSSFILAFQALPIIIVLSAITALLTYWRILPFVIRVLSLVLNRCFGLSGAVGLGCAANVFVGMVEAPLFIGAYVAKMRRSELFILMTCGMSTIAGTVMVLYATFLTNIIPNPIGHLLVASLLSVPAAIAVSLVMLPVERTNNIEHQIDEVNIEQSDSSSMGAIVRGSEQGLKLCLQIIALLLVLVSLVSLLNATLAALLPNVLGAPISLQRTLGYIMAPLAWIIGVPWSESVIAGQLLGTKTVLNELIAFRDLASLDPNALSRRSKLIVTYALCGFANIGSLGILIGGLGTLVPQRRQEIIALGAKSIVAGTLATLLTAAVVGVIH